MILRKKKRKKEKKKKRKNKKFSGFPYGYSILI